MRILIVDDSKPAQFFMKEILDEYGHCDIAANGKEAVDYVEASLIRPDTAYDVIFMDIMMPEMDGLAAAGKIVEIQEQHGVEPDERAKMVMISCLDDSGHMMRAHFESGADMYLPKPVNKDNIVEAMVNLELLDNPLDEDDA